MAVDRENIHLMPSLDKNGKIAQLQLTTRKNSSRGGVYSHASVVFVSNGCITFELCGDYSSTRAQDRTVRATQAAIDAMHARVFTPDVVAAIKAEAEAHYAAKK